MTFENYHTESFYDEMFLPDGSPRPEARQLVERIEGLPDGELVRRHQTAERSLLHTGITFTVYGDEAGTERIFPFDIVPRIVSRETWDPIERGLKQRVEALNLFIDDVYHDRKIVRDGVVPADVIESSQGYRTECIGIDPPAADDVGKPIDGLQWGGSAPLGERLRSLSPDARPGGRAGGGQLPPAQPRVSAVGASLRQRGPDLAARGDGNADPPVLERGRTSARPTRREARLY